MIEGRVIICLASSWDYDPTSKHQIMKILSKRNFVLWVNYHGTRPPKANLKDARACIKALKRVSQGPRPIHETMVQFTPLVFPGASSAPVRFAQKHLLVTQLKRAIRKLPVPRSMPIQIWSFAPDVPYLIGSLNEERFVYYCVDEYTKFEGFNTDAIRRAEAKMLTNADVVLTTSQSLYESKTKVRPDTRLVRHGVDFEHFAKAWREDLSTPEDITHICGPVFGFFGLIHHWIDVALIARVAHLRPQYNFVLIGDSGVDVSTLGDLPNVHLLGRKPYEMLPAYCAHFDAGLLPFVRSEMTENINPIKMTEYLAAGLPIVSTSLPEARRYGKAIRFGESPESFANACDHVLVNQPSDKIRRTRRREAISKTVQNNSWSATVEQLSAIILSGSANTKQHRITKRLHTSAWEFGNPELSNLTDQTMQKPEEKLTSPTNR